MSKVFTFELEHKLAFSNLEDAGRDDETMQIYFREPTYREVDHASKIEQHVYQAFLGAQNSGAGDSEAAKQARENKQQSDEPEKITGVKVMVMFGMFSRDLNQILRDFEKLALRTGYINDMTPLVAKHYNHMDLATIKRLCGEYIAFFTMPSVISSMESAFSDN